MTPDEINAGQIQYWNEIAGAKWVANQERLDRLMAPLTDALAAAAAPRRGETMLDVGPGCGDLALRLADALGAQGHILAVDVSAPMLEHAEARRTRLPAGDRASIEWRLADAMIAPLEPVHDLLVSRFGVMFFDDPPRAFANLHSAMRAGGRFALLTWRPRSENEWMQAPLDWIASVLPTPPEVPGEIGPFAFADREATIALFSAAGFRDVQATAIDRRLIVGAAGPGAVDPGADAREEAFVILADTGPAARELRDAPPETKAKALELMRAGIAANAAEGVVALGGACWIYTGRA